MGDDAHKVTLRFGNATDAIEAFDLVERLIPRGVLERGFLSMTPDFEVDPDELAAAERAVIETTIDRLCAVNGPLHDYLKADQRNADAARELLRLRAAQAKQRSGG